MWQAVRENPRAVVYAVVMHLGLLALLVFSLDWTPKITRPAGVKVPIEAQLVDQRVLQAQEEKKREEQRRKEEADRKQFIKSMLGDKIVLKGLNKMANVTVKPKPKTV